MMTRNTVRRFGHKIGGACSRGFEKVAAPVARYGKAAAMTVVSAGAATLAHADPTGIDVTAVTGTITAQLVPIGLVGAAVLGLIVAVKAYKWVRSAL